MAQGPHSRDRHNYEREGDPPVRFSDHSSDQALSCRHAVSELRVNGSSQTLSDADCKGTAVIRSNCEIQP